MRTGVLSEAERAALDALREVGTATVEDLARRTGAAWRTMDRILSQLNAAGLVVVVSRSGSGLKQTWRLARPGEALPIPEPEPDPPEEDVAVYRKRLETVTRVRLAAIRDETHPDHFHKPVDAYLRRIDEALELDGVA